MNFLEEWKRLAKEKGKNNRIEDDKREARKVSHLELICFLGGLVWWEVKGGGSRR